MWKLSLVFTVTIALTLGHVRIRSPPNRSSLWRDPAFQQYNPPANYDDDGLYCGRVHQWPVDNRCGVCGDPVTDPVPRPNENGGTFGRGIIAGRYAPGEIIPLSVEFTISHIGFFEVQVCDQLPETDSCFRKLKFGDGSERYTLTPPERPIWINTTVVLPLDIKCQQCTLRLHYRAGNNWGDCGDGTEGMGCGLQETFRSCVDISVL
ncbi:unnamed protein product [Allacma fusca]|uniref:Chitin-binding type-4 domain-containing protein n=1 Tax=Allacma fusca TaxID=39272 RepID=A0A8J2JDI1_9HEXA|nr:unnamed protein product [Allacma fusca]